MDETNADVLTAAQWPTSTKVQLLEVPWDSAYRDVVAWGSKDDRDQWLADHLTGSWFDSGFQTLRPGEPIAVPVPYSSAYKYNYCCVTNPMQPVTDEGPQRTYCYFINDVTYLSGQATLLTLQLDVMTTYAGEMKLGRCYVERGHIAMANPSANTGDITGEQLNRYFTVPEGLDTGSTLVPVARSMWHAIDTSDGKGSAVVVVSTIDLTRDPGTVDKPSLRTASGSDAEGLVSGCEVYVMEGGAFGSFMSVGASYPWLMQGIVSIYSFPRVFIDSNLVGESVTLFGGKVSVSGTVTKLNSSIGAGDPRATVYESGNVYDQLAKGLADSKDLRKLYCWPYAVIELSSFDGNPVFLKPELVSGNKLTINAICCALMPFARVGLYPFNYARVSGDDQGFTFSFPYVGESGGTLTKTGIVAMGDFLDTAVWLSDFPQFSIVNNNAILSMANTANTRAYNYQSAGWSYTKSGMGAQNAADVSRYQAGVGLANAAQSNNASALNSAIGIGGNVIGGVLGGNILGSVVSGAASGLQAANTYMTNADINQRNYQAANTVTDMNLALANSVNQGDYQNAIAGINAQVQDTQLTPPSTVGQAGGNGFNWRNGLVGLCITYKTVAPGTRAQLVNYFRRYGYGVNRYLALGTPKWMLCMDHFAYWKVKETTLTCAHANESERQAMRGVFEKGVTLWARPEYIGTTSLFENQPILDTRYSYK